MSKRIKNILHIVAALKLANVKIEGNVLDITDAKLGNKTWGYIEYLILAQGFKLEGEVEHRAVNKKLYYSSEDVEIKKAKPNKVQDVKHSYELVHASKDRIPSEHEQYRKMMELQEKFNPAEHYHAIKDYINKFSKYIKNRYEFSGETIFQSQFEACKRQLSTREKKLRSIR